MKEYRTQEQFDEMIENMINGNWTDAGHNGVEYGFYANDILKKIEENDHWSIELGDIVLLVEIITEQRLKK